MTEQPFRGSEALRAGVLSEHRLRSQYRAVYRDVYLARGAQLTAVGRARAAWLWAGPDSTLAGISAAAVHGTKWLDDNASAEVIRSDRHSPRGIVVHTFALDDVDVRSIRGMKVTSPARTAFDIGRMMKPESPFRTIAVLDALLRATATKPADVLALADGRSGTRGVRVLRNAIALADGGAESPQESRVRLLLVGAGLPRPETQIEFRDDYGHTNIRVDMGWPEWKVAVEYDGVQHWLDPQQRSWDIERIAILESMGWKVIRVSAEMLRRPRVIVERVCMTLQAAGCPI